MKYFTTSQYCLHHRHQNHHYHYHHHHNKPHHHHLLLLFLIETKNRQYSVRTHFSILIWLAGFCAF